MTHQPFPIYIGYDSREPAAFAVLVDSLIKTSTIPLQIIPLALKSVSGTLFHRQNEGSTEFSMTRFLVPYMSGYKGWSLFMDCDMLVQTDIAELIFEILAQTSKAILVCQHDYIPKSATKFLGEKQVNYPRKNWSSFMVFNNARCMTLTPEYVNRATGQQLHRFEWLQDDQIGSLPLEWNWLVDEYPDNKEAKILHYTNGGPWFEPDCPMADTWLKAAAPIERGIILHADVS